jgi:multidrug resistance efflux pump
MCQAREHPTPPPTSEASTVSLEEVASLKARIHMLESLLQRAKELVCQGVVSAADHETLQNQCRQNDLDLWERIVILQTVG